MYHSIHVEVRRQFVGRESLPPPYGLQGLNSEPQVASAFTHCTTCQPMTVCKTLPRSTGHGTAPILPALRKHCTLGVSLGYKVSAKPPWTAQ